MDMADEHIIHGEELTVPISTKSLGAMLYDQLINSAESSVFIDASSGENVTNKMLLKNSGRLAQSLRNFGLNKTDVIAVCSENSLYYSDPILAALFCGIPVTTFSPHYTEGELLYVANLSEPSIIFCSTETSSVVLKVRDRLKSVPKVIILDSKDDYNGCQSLENFVEDHIPKSFDVKGFKPNTINVKEDVAFILYSSGTTGLPKGVMLTHFNYNASIAICEDVLKSRALNKPAVAFVPLYHAYGIFLICVKILWGGIVIIMKKFHPELYLKLIQDYKIDDLNIVPSIANFLVKSDLVNKYDLSSIKTIFSGAAPLSKDIQEGLMERFKVKEIQQGYGMTETTAGTLSHLRSTKGSPPGSCGIVLPSLSVKVVDVDTGKSLGPMQSGELWCRGSVIMKGYLNNPEATNEAVDKDGWLHTGDIAYYDKDFVFYIVDRLKEIMKCKGFQVAPAELEAILINHPKIADAGVIGVPDERDGEVPFGFIVPVTNQVLSENEIEDFLAGQVAPYKRLKGGVKFVSQIPRNASGKILHRVLRDEFFKESLQNKE